MFQKDQVEIEADPIKSLEVFPGVLAAPLAPGVFVQVQEGDWTNGRVRYQYQQEFMVEQKPALVTLVVSYQVVNGVALVASVVTDNEQLFFGEEFQAAVIYNGQTPMVSCNTQPLEERKRTLRLENGDRLDLTQRGWMQGCHGGYSGNDQDFSFELVEARLEHLETSRLVTDFFHLSSAINHHCSGGPGYLVRFEPSFGEVHKLLIDEFGLGQNVLFLDSENNLLEQVPYQDE